MQRLADKLEVYSQMGAGTVLLARVRAGDDRPAPQTGPLDSGFICLPIKGEEVSGDAVGLRIGIDGGTFMVADGLGHGVAANDASLEAAKIFSEERTSVPTQLLDSMNSGLRSTRGAAIAVATIDCHARNVRYSGVGNIAGAIFRGEASRSLISHKGIIGHQLPRLQEFTYEWPRDGVLIMNSDGLVTNWRLNQYPGLLQKDPTVIAAVLYRDFSRGRDDVSILVVKEGGDA
jgi:serine phosphatase RsbU (regulator of sigma subunit)